MKKRKTSDGKYYGSVKHIIIIYNDFERIEEYDYDRHGNDITDDHETERVFNQYGFIVYKKFGYFVDILNGNQTVEKYYVYDDNRLYETTTVEEGLDNDFEGRYHYNVIIKTRYYYDGKDRLIREESDNECHDITVYDYDNDKLLKKSAQINGEDFVELYSYNENIQLTEISRSKNGKLYEKETFAYDEEGHLTHRIITQYIFHQYHTFPTPNGSVVYAYSDFDSHGNFQKEIIRGMNGFQEEKRYIIKYHE